MEKKSLNKVLKPLQKCSRIEAGTKGYNLKLLSKIDGVTIPPTLCIPTTFFDQLRKTNNFEKIRDAKSFKFPVGFTKLCMRQIHATFGNQKLVIRSSATCEDTPFLSFAGNYSSFLNISGEKQIMHAIKLCYLSLFNDYARVYAQRGHVDITKHKMAILVQPVAQVVQTGIMFTTHPMTRRKREVVIEYTEGLGDAIVSGFKCPTTLFLNVSHTHHGTFDSLAKLGKKIEKAFGHPQDIEWGVLENGSFILFQSRPITTVRRSSNGMGRNLSSTMQKHILAKGVAASAGVGVGRLVRIKCMRDMHHISDNSILFFDGAVGLNFLNHLPKIKGVLTHGGMLSHIAVIARELSIPMVANISAPLSVGARTIYVDGNKGLIFTL